MMAGTFRQEFEQQLMFPDDHFVCLYCFLNGSVTCTEGGAHGGCHGVWEDAGPLLHLPSDSEKTAPLSQGSPPLEPATLGARKVTGSLLEGEEEKEE